MPVTINTYSTVGQDLVTNVNKAVALAGAETDVTKQLAFIDVKDLETIVDTYKKYNDKKLMSNLNKLNLFADVDLSRIKHILATAKPESQDGNVLVNRCTVLASRGNNKRVEFVFQKQDASMFAVTFVVSASKNKVESIIQKKIIKNADNKFTTECLLDDLKTLASELTTVVGTGVVQPTTTTTPPPTETQPTTGDTGTTTP